MTMHPRLRGTWIEREAGSTEPGFRALGPFLHAEIANGATLFVATLIALALANSPLALAFDDVLHPKVGVDLAATSLYLDVREWVNDGLMSFFFLLVGLEVKRELVHGELAGRKKAALPLAAAAGGMVLPALIYLALNAGRPGARGWGIPVATDIAFALGVVTLLGDRIPPSLKIFLLAFAAADDVGGVVVIAIFYAERLSLGALAIVGVILLVIVALQRRGVRSLPAYALLGAALWLATLKSGLHPTVAGVLLGLLTPAHPYSHRDAYLSRAEHLIGRYRTASAQNDDEQVALLLGQLEERTRSTDLPLERVERQLRPWVSYAVLPLFALTNAGIHLDRVVIVHALTSPVTIGVVAGLVVGKVVGVSLATWAAVRFGIGALPHGLGWRHVIGVAMIGSIGFTVSLFIADLAFIGSGRDADARVGILVGSIVGGLGGALWLRFMAPRRRASHST